MTKLNLAVNFLDLDKAKPSSKDQWKFYGKNSGKKEGKLSWFSRKIETPRKRASKEPKETQHKYQNTKEANREATIKTSNNFQTNIQPRRSSPSRSTPTQWVVSGPAAHCRTGLGGGRGPSWTSSPKPCTAQFFKQVIAHPMGGEWLSPTQHLVKRFLRQINSHRQKVRGGAAPQHTPIGCRAGNGSRLPAPLPFTHGHGTATLFAVLLHQHLLQPFFKFA